MMGAQEACQMAEIVRAKPRENRLATRFAFGILGEDLTANTLHLGIS